VKLASGKKKHNWFQDVLWQIQKVLARAVNNKQIFNSSFVPMH
jgi:hypothetical protein